MGDAVGLVVARLREAKERFMGVLYVAAWMTDENHSRRIDLC